MTPEFDDFAQDYRRLLRHPLRDWFAPSGDFFARRKLELINAFLGRRGLSTKELRWLDVGCGQGDLLRLGRGEFASVAGCDPSPAMLAACGDLPVQAQPSADELPYSSESFDLVTLVCVLHHVAPEQRSALIRESARMLRPGGWLCVIEHNPWNPITRTIVRRSPVDQGARLLAPSAAGALLTENELRQSELSYFLLIPERFFPWIGNWEKHFRRLPLGGQYGLFARREAVKSERTESAEAPANAALRTSR